MTTPDTTPAPEATASDAPLARAKALLAELGPARALEMLAALRMELGDGEASPSPSSTSSDLVDEEGESDSADEDGDGDAEDAEREDGESEGDDEGAETEDEPDDGADVDADDMETEAPPAPRAPARRRRVAGIVEPGPRVLSCRVRVLHESGTRGELVGRTNAQGVEETEWPLATMTPEFFKHLTRRGGQFMFEWFGRDESGKRVALGRSTSIRVRGVAKPRAERAHPAPLALAPPPTPPVGGFGFEQFLALQRYQDERSDQERARRERAQAQVLETQRHQAALASKERIRRMEIEADLAKSRPPSGPQGVRLDERAVRATIEREVEEAVAQSKKDTSLPPWLEHLGVTPEALAMLKPQLQTLLPTIMAKLQDIGPKAPPTVTPSTSRPVHPYTPTRFVPPGGES